MRNAMLLLGLALAFGNAASAVGAAATPTTRPLEASLILSERHCQACHAVTPEQSGWLYPGAAPRLDDVAGRQLPEAVRHQILYGGRSMPALFRDRSPEQRVEAADAVTHYLFSLHPGPPPRVRPDRAAVARGDKLYHAVGCVACHGPIDPSKKSPGTESAELSDLSTKWPWQALGAFLIDPLKAHPSGRMPSLNLTDAEAGDIAHFLLRDVKVSGTLEVTVYDGRLSRPEDMDEATPVRSRLVEGFDAGMVRADRRQGLRYAAFLNVPAGGAYTFHVTCDDACRLVLDDAQPVVELDARSNADHPPTRTGRVTLTAGWHALRLDCLHHREQAAMKVEWEGPGIGRDDPGRQPANRERARR